MTRALVSCPECAATQFIRVACISVNTTAFHDQPPSIFPMIDMLEPMVIQCVTCGKIWQWDKDERLFKKYTP